MITLERRSNLVLRLDDDVFDENGDSLLRLPFGGNPLTLRSAPSEDVFSLYYPEEERYPPHTLRTLNSSVRRAVCLFLCVKTVITHRHRVKGYNVSSDYLFQSHFQNLHKYRISYFRSDMMG